MTNMEMIWIAKLPATVKQKRKVFISCCPVLDVCSQGNTKKEALDNLIEALSLFLISCFERGTINEVLKESGLTPIDKLPGKRKAFPPGFESINVPLPFQIGRKSESDPCHA